MVDLVSLFSAAEPELPCGSEYSFDARETLSFRLSPEFEKFMALLETYIRTRDCSNLNEALRILSILCLDFDFACQFGSYGGHQLLKRAGDIPVMSEMCESVISSILQSGCSYPMPKDIAHKENIVRPLKYSFLKSEDGCETIDIVLRQVPATMHGEGQSAVGYIIWSAAVILGRWGDETIRYL